MGNGAADTGLREHIAGLMGQVRAELAELVAIPSVADARQFPPEECARAARWVRDAFAGVGFRDAWLAEMSDGSQAVLGSRPCADPDAPTVLLYAHYDVQPPLNEDAWRTPPFAADRGGRALVRPGYRRLQGQHPHASDGAAGLRRRGAGQSEAGHRRIGGARHRRPGGVRARSIPDLLRADAILVCDTGNAAVGRTGRHGQPARRWPTWSSRSTR